MSESNNPEPLIVDHQLCFSLYATSRAITKVYGSLLKDMGLTYPQYLTLMVLWRDNGISIQQIANKLEIEGATATPLIRRIEKLGLVKRQHCEKDHRLIQIYLTEEGDVLRKKSLCIPSQLGQALGITHVEADKMVVDLKKIRNKLV
jgi:DNA-binding MarR family transcriptional regulator